MNCVDLMSWYQLCDVCRGPRTGMDCVSYDSCRLRGSGLAWAANVIWRVYMSVDGPGGGKVTGIGIVVVSAIEIEIWTCIGAWMVSATGTDVLVEVSL